MDPHLEIDHVSDFIICSKYPVLVVSIQPKIPLGLASDELTLCPMRFRKITLNDKQI
jgi:hypothetical protein